MNGTTAQNMLQWILKKMKNKIGMTPHHKNILLISLAALNAAERAEAAELLLQTATFLAKVYILT